MLYPFKRRSILSCKGLILVRAGNEETEDEGNKIFLIHIEEE